MKIFKNIIFFAVFFIFKISYAYSSDKALTVVTSINPIYQIAKFISADNNKIILSVDPNISEHNYTPKPSDIRNINNAELVFYISDDLEYYLPKILKSTNNKARIVQLINSKGLKLLKVKNLDKTDPHIWLNPDNAVIIAEVIAENLSKIDAKNSKKYQNNLKKFISQIDENKKLVQENFSKMKKINYVIYHNCYQYFEDYFQISSPEIMPSNWASTPGFIDVKRIGEIIHNNHISCIIGQPQEESKVAQEIANSNKIKLVISDIIGDKNFSAKNKEKNGYLELMNKLVADFSSCMN